jgi:hypothetical protein
MRKYLAVWLRVRWFDSRSLLWEGIKEIKNGNEETNWNVISVDQERDDRSFKNGEDKGDEEK